MSIAFCAVLNSNCFLENHYKDVPFKWKLIFRQKFLVCLTGNQTFFEIVINLIKFEGMVRLWPGINLIATIQILT